MTDELVHEVRCPHCRKSFTAEVIAGRAARYRGFKCPHCRLFVPAERASDGDSPQTQTDAA